MQDPQRETKTHIESDTRASDDREFVSSAYELPVSQFIQWAYEHRFELQNDSWQSPLWSFTRLLKGHPQLIGLSPNEALKIVEKVLARWHPRDFWMLYFELATEDAEVEFLSSWEKVRFVPGWEPLAQAIKRAQALRLLPRNKRTPGYEMFISIAGWLQVTMGDRNIMLPCEKLAEYLECKPMTISRYRAWAVEDGLLRIVKEHRFRSKPGGGEATEFRFDTSRYECLA